MSNHDSLFEDDLLHLAKQAVNLQAAKTAFVGAGDPSQGQAGGAPPQDPSAGGAMPPDPSAGGGGGDPTAPDPMEVRLQSLEQKLMASGGGGAPGGAGGAGAGGKNQKAEDSMLLRQLVNMMAVLFARQGWEVPPQVMMPESVSGIPAGSPQVQQVVDQTQQGAEGQQQGPGSVLGDTPGPPQSITPLSSVLGSPQGDSGGAAAGGAKSGAYIGHSGIAVTAETLKLAGAPPKPKKVKKATTNEPPDILDLLDVA
jgi:hypothetical protein